MILHNSFLRNSSLALCCDLRQLLIVLNAGSGPCLNDRVVLDRDIQQPAHAADEAAEAKFKLGLLQTGFQFQKRIQEIQRHTGAVSEILRIRIDALSLLEDAFPCNGKQLLPGFHWQLDRQCGNT